MLAWGVHGNEGDRHVPRELPPRFPLLIARTHSFWSSGGSVLGLIVERFVCSRNRTEATKMYPLVCRGSCRIKCTGHLATNVNQMQTVRASSLKLHLQHLLHQNSHQKGSRLSLTQCPVVHSDYRDDKSTLLGDAIPVSSHLM